MKEWTREERYRVLKDPEEVRELYGRISKSEYRQTFHIQPVTGLLNDPNGFVYHDGKWHLFYQWCPWGAVHGLKYWYHVISEDLITWKNQGVCIKPDTIYDNKGAYSGSALTTKDAMYLYYTGNHRDENWVRKPYTCVVKMDNDGRTEKMPEPIFGPNPGYTEHQRDPKIIYNDLTVKYYVVLGAQNKDKKGRILIYSSNDKFTGWEFAGELKVKGFENFGTMWECPSVEHIRGKDVLLFCPQHLQIPGRETAENHNGYIIGHMDWDTLTFTPEGSFHVLDFGFDSYAAECAATSKYHNESEILVAWMGLPDVGMPTDEDEWSGCLTLPRELTVRNRRLIQKPLPQLKALRGEEIDAKEGILPGACEMEIYNHGADMDLRLFTKADGSGGVRIFYDGAQGKIKVDRSGMTKRFDIEHGEIRTRPLDHILEHLRIFIDHSSVEIFVNDGDAVFSSRIFPTCEEHNFTVSGDTEINIWEMRPAVKDEFII